MRVLIVTVAGMSSRFSESIGEECLKCIYYTNTIEESLLYRLLYQPVEFDRYIIVGGYKFEKLQAVLNDKFRDKLDKIELVFNPQFSKYGSGYSLYCGLAAALEYKPDEIVFAEGDLFVDEASYRKVCLSSKSVITCNREAILANRAVAFYFDLNNIPHYIYDTGHSALVIAEPFLAVYNSGQIWKFSDSAVLKEVYKSLSDEEWKGTNLVLVEKYFNRLPCEEYEIIALEKWINCNTISDFRKTLDIDEGNVSR